ncbi:MAG: sialidase family protein [Pirellulaceae bacterium]|nr:sialidase family protein [Pirellulaceae bacterium]
MIVTCLLLLVGALWRAAPDDELAAARTDVVKLFVSGEGYGRYRIPALVVTPRGTLLALCEGRVKAAGLTGDIDLVLRRSEDGGKTWSPLAVVADDGPNTLGNPCPTIDRTTGTIWLPFTRSLGSDTEQQIVAGTSRERTQVWLTHSTDDGRTWAKPVNISAQATRPEWTWYGTGPGFGLQLPGGRLLVPSYHAVEKTGIYQVHSLYSDDHGKTWQIGGIVADETTEAQAALRTDGSLVINCRNIAPRDNSILRNRVVATSRDGGITWHDVSQDKTLTESSCQGSLLVYSGLAKGEKSRWLFTNPPGPGRNRLTIRLSHDEGRTWIRSAVVDPVTTEYSCLARLPDGGIGLVYERDTTPGKYSVDIVFTRLSMEELAD